MEKEKNKFDILKKNDPKSVYDIPEDYFNSLDVKINKQINRNKLIQKPKLISISHFAKVAAIFLFVVGAYFILQMIIYKPSKPIYIKYSQLSESIDDYLLSDDELFYTFINHNDYTYMNLDENMEDYFDTEIDFY
ncbi:MAG: hypothetical protein CL846_04115 [Crocinitomicaceae bacterium]|nr:hypothetical protein [Crocinitomicaceae bacterium]|tara:strand:- start:7697 stop:8101 length:405 start_codon:yes stop_codon:yes gene_type:complete